jgi:V-type H+-transporting ATPase subunit a
LGKSKDLNALISVKYMVTMMGFFALYCGLIYNDFLSMSLNLFGSCWEEGGGKSALGKGEGCNYVFGVDPIWGVAENKLTFYNSLKMKLAVILGVLQMILGIFVKGSNAIYFRSSINFFCEFIPQIIFMCCTFGYMCLMIIWKWNTDYTHDTSKAPSLLNAMLNFGLNLGDWQGVPLFENQEKY